jgi:electron transfer flavoprotein beta subunit
MDDLQLDINRCGVHGSPTKVHKVESVVLAGGNHETIAPTKDGMSNLIDKLMENHILG